MVPKMRIDAATAEPEFGMACQRLVPRPDRPAEPPFGMMACFLAPGAASAPDQHDQEEYLVVLTGSGCIDVAGKTTELAVGDVVLVERNLVHVVRNDAADPLSWLSCYWPLHEPVGGPS